MENHTKILVFGDSKSWGQIPSLDDTVRRYQKDERWSGKLALNLGTNFEVIEECLPGRTASNINSGLNKYRNGLEYFAACYRSHLPLDYLILDLGANDLNANFDCDAQTLFDALVEFQEIINRLNWKIKTSTTVLYLLPMVVQDYSLHEKYPNTKQKIDELKRMMINKCMHFVDTDVIVQNIDRSCDDIHLTIAQHHKIYSYFYDFFKQIKLTNSAQRDQKVLSNSKLIEDGLQELGFIRVVSPKYQEKKLILNSFKLDEFDINIIKEAKSYISIKIYWKQIYFQLLISPNYKYTIDTLKKEIEIKLNGVQLLTTAHQILSIAMVEDDTLRLLTTTENKLDHIIWLKSARVFSKFKAFKLRGLLAKVGTFVANDIDLRKHAQIKVYTTLFGRDLILDFRKDETIELQLLKSLPL